MNNTILITVLAASVSFFATEASARCESLNDHVGVIKVTLPTGSFESQSPLQTQISSSTASAVDSSFAKTQHEKAFNENQARYSQSLAQAMAGKGIKQVTLFDWLIAIFK